MKQELKEAAERLRRINAGESSATVYGRDIDVIGLTDPTCQYVVDMRLALGDWLSQHPADEDELVTEEWLRSVKFVPDGAHLALRGWGPDRNGTIQFYVSGVWYLNGIRLRQMKTRGDIRRLAAALGVPLKEGNQK